MAKQPMSKEQQQKMLEVIEGLKKKIDGLEKMKRKLLDEKGTTIEPEQTRAMLEEIVVPPLEAITEEMPSEKKELEKKKVVSA